MTSNAPWSVKGIDPKAREAAKELARQSGMTLGEWLNHSIREQGANLRDRTTPARRPAALARTRSESDAGGSISDALQRLTERIEAAEQRSTLAVTGIDQSVRGMLSRLDLSEREQVSIGARFEGALQEAAEGQSKIAQRLAKLEDQASGPRSAEALKSLESALGRVAAHLYEGESRTRDTLADLKRDISGLAGRIDAVEQGKGGLVDAVAARVAADLAQRLESAEARTGAAMKGLERSFAQMDLRMATVEDQVDSGAVGGGAGAEQRFEKLASDLTTKIEAARTEMAAKLTETADGRFERMERTFSEMAAHIQAAERRSAQALETMGQEVLRMADTLSRRVQGVEHRSADAIEQVGGEVSRVVTTLETRLNRSEGAQAQALEKLGVEIARITERLSERIGTAERRSAQAIDDVGEQVTRVTERLNQRYDRASSDLAERIRQSEERTARLLEDAKDRIDQRLSETRKAVEAPAVAAAAPRAPSAYAEPSGFSDPFAAPPFGHTGPMGAAMAPPPNIYPDAAPFGQTFAPAGFTLAEPEFDDADMDAANNFASVAEAGAEADFVEARAPEPAAPTFYEEDVVATPIEDQAISFAPTPTRNLSTRELIEQARAAARAASQEHDSRGKTKPAKAAKSEGQRGVSIPFVSRKKRGGLKTALLVSGTAAVCAIAFSGWMMLESEGAGTVSRIAENQIAPSEEILTPEADTTPRAAIALSPTPIDPTEAAPSPAAAANAAALYADGARRVDAGDSAGLEPLRKAANLGYGPAQFRLGKFYEDGSAGLKKDLAEARRWYQRAADGGYNVAMHNLGTLHYNGWGGPVDKPAAARWFRRAADLGMTDAQFNLAMLYFKGEGVPANSVEAYKWFTIASRNGTEEERKQARAAAETAKATLSTAERSQAERAANAYTAMATPARTAPLQGLSTTSAQRALSRLGYFRGTEDGADSTALRLALKAFQRDQSLSPTGEMDTVTASRLASYAR